MNKTHAELCEEVQQLRQGIRQMATALGGGEWTDLLTADQDLGDLEDAVRSLVEKHNALVEARTKHEGMAETMDSALTMLVWSLGFTPEELEPPLLKEMGDVRHARQMDRKLLEEKYALARMTARLSLHKAHQLEAERDAQANRVEYLNEQSSAQAEQIDELEIQTAQLSSRVVEGDVERDALGVQMVQTNSAGHALYRELKQWSLTERDPESAAAMREWERVWSEVHTTALARRDAEKQAEAFEAKEKELRRRGYGAVADEMAEEATKLRRQAELAEPAKEDAA